VRRDGRAVRATQTLDASRRDPGGRAQHAGFLSAAATAAVGVAACAVRRGPTGCVAAAARSAAACSAACRPAAAVAAALGPAQAAVAAVDTAAAIAVDDAIAWVAVVLSAAVRQDAGLIDRTLCEG
jgi:hypothetical protein